MIILLSPAKSLKIIDRTEAPLTEPRLMTDTWKLAKELKTKSSEDLQSLMHISAKLGDENAKRYKTFKRKHTAENARPAIDIFDGDVYKGLDAETLSAEGMAYAQDHVRILSGLYGLLRPMDLMQEYRLEMGTSLTTDRGTNLYQFWDTKITNLIKKDLKENGGDTVINLASNEYYKAVKAAKLNSRVIEINFKEMRDDKLKFISFNAKKARGLCTRYIIDHQLTNPDDIKGFNTEGYYFSEEHSTDDSWLFIR